MFGKYPLALKASAILVIATFALVFGASHSPVADAAPATSFTISAVSPSGCSSTSVNWTLGGTNPIDATTITFSVTGSAGTFSPSATVSVPSTAGTTATGSVTFTPSVGVSGTAQIMATATSGASTLTATPATIQVNCASSTCTTTTVGCNCTSLVLGQCVTCDNITIPCNNCNGLYGGYAGCSGCGYATSAYVAGCNNCATYGSSLYFNGCNPCGTTYTYSSCLPPVVGGCNNYGCGTACGVYGCTNICTTSYCNATCTYSNTITNYGVPYGYTTPYNNFGCAGPPSNLTISVPSSVSCGSQTDVTAIVTDPAGNRVPDGTPVGFSANLGYVTGSANTSGGSATASFQVAPRMQGVATITATVGNLTKTATVNINCAPPQQQASYQPQQPAYQPPVQQQQQFFRPPNTGDGGLLSN